MLLSVFAFHIFIYMRNYLFFKLSNVKISILAPLKSHFAQQSNNNSHNSPGLVLWFKHGVLYLSFSFFFFIWFYSQGFYHRRWKAEEERQILNQLGGYQRTEEQWNREWEEHIRHVSQNEFPFGPNGAQFGSLEEIHIFVLANILRRTIIVMSDDTLRGPYGDSYSPINFGGIYLPLWKQM